MTKRTRMLSFTNLEWRWSSGNLLDYQSGSPDSIPHSTGFSNESPSRYDLCVDGTLNQSSLTHSLALTQVTNDLRIFINCTRSLQIRGNRDNLGIISHISSLNIFRDPSLEPSPRDGSNEGSQHMFSLRNKKNYL